jgi:acetyl esterase/lipase
LHDHAAEFGGDPGRIFLLGISAGAQLAAVELEIGTAGDKPTSAIAEFIDRLSAAPDAEAPAWVTPVVTAPRVRFQTFHSAAAKAKVSYHLYTPAIYDQEPERKFPVLYWLHGSGGGLAGIPQLARHFDTTITGGKAPPFLVVFVNGLVEGMYVDWKDGSAPLETVIVKDLVPHIDATWRTIAMREGRMLV